MSIPITSSLTWRHAHSLPADAQSPWQNRKGVLAQNVLAAVNFNFEFVYVLAGWE
ncbi:hypothetical protein PSTG_12796 [Puccinia striiformis f. sp. tritici PST-78]|uniref:Uncharacterized protein n=1 Tax=Puccinia striiformis f. sp. tritici PST-78 TaxID=1165861 RepID=A0A0L0V3J4_9BASI|nr:hypothetical protein PSTG_12796 [Puccinia striiformis f. sp. tritici PST-78]